MMRHRPGKSRVACAALTEPRPQGSDSCHSSRGTTRRLHATHQPRKAPRAAAATPSAGTSRATIARAGAAPHPHAAARKSESGFALLFVFLAAAIIAISLYLEAPRLAFQAQRQKEQILMERGEQYKRAIGLFLRTNKNTRWPATIEELENYNNRRFLRHRYIDPLTGKDEWRLIHIANGVLTDSVTNKKKDAAGDHLSKDGSVMELGGLAGIDSTGQPGVNAVNRRRASDGGSQTGPDGQPVTVGGVLPPLGGAGTGGAPLPPGATGPAPFNPLAGGGPLPNGLAGGNPVPIGVAGGNPAPNGIGGIAGLLGIPTAPTGSTGSSSPPVNYGMGNGISAVGGGTPVQSTVPGALPGNFQNGGQFGAPGAGQQGGAGAPGFNPQAQAAAANMIQNLLTQPRPGGMNGLPTQGGAIMGGGIAGVASKGEGDSIMVYADKTTYGEWEFIYDPMKFVAPPNPNTGSSVGTPVQQMGSSPNATGPNVTNQVGTPVSNLPGGIGGAGVGGIGGIGGAGTNGAPGGSGSTGAPTGGSSAYGQAGPPDIRPGKR